MPWRRFYEWLLFARSRRELAVLAALGWLPIAVSVLDGTWQDRNVAGEQLRGVCHGLRGSVKFLGLESAPNWWIYPVVLPLAVFLLRKMAQLAIGNSANATPAMTELVPEPELVREADRESVTARVRRTILSGWVPGAALIIIAVIALFETAGFVRVYALGNCPAEKDWTVFFLAGNGVLSRDANAFHVAISYAIQYAMGWVVLTTAGLALIHNIVYLRLIYQRRRTHDPNGSITLLLDDPLNSFGQHKLRPGFRYQAFFVVLTGSVVAISRYHNVSINATELIWRRVLEAKTDRFQWLGALVDALKENEVRRQLYPDTGQWALAILFSGLFLVAALPSLLKFLPFGKEGMISHTNLSDYLAEFIPPGSGPEPTTMDRESLRDLARRFACNSFWPAGDRWAAFLFTFAFAILVFVLLPVPLAPASLVVQYVAVLLTFSAAATGATFLLYKNVLALVDVSLTKPKE